MKGAFVIRICLFLLLAGGLAGKAPGMIIPGGNDRAATEQPPGEVGFYGHDIIDFHPIDDMQDEDYPDLPSLITRICRVCPPAPADAVSIPLPCWRPPDRKS